jgi:hypothetical protein
MCDQNPIIVKTLLKRAKKIDEALHIQKLINLIKIYSLRKCYSRHK